MRVIPTRTHGVIDYATGLLLIVVPYLLGFANGGAAQYVPQLLGAAIILMSLCTDYELSATLTGSPEVWCSLRADPARWDPRPAARRRPSGRR